MPRLRTVRAKLIALVGLSAIVMFIALPLLSWMMHRQLVDEVDDRVPEAMRGFAIELDDDLRDLEIGVRSLATNREALEALRKRDVGALRTAGAAIHELYPDIDLLFFDTDGKLVESVGVATPPKEASTIGAAERGVFARGCEAKAGAPPAYTITRNVPDAGLLVACMPIDGAHLANASAKLGVELALLTPEGTAAGATPQFPHRFLASLGADPTIGTSGETTWALARFSPERLASPAGSFAVVAALDVTDIRNIVRQNLTVAIVVLTLAAVACMAIGARMASVMSSALARVNAALKKLEQQQYVHVDAVRTGDELEDLAAGFNTMVDGLKERDRLRTTFGKYMTEAVLEHLLAGKVELGGETLTVTVLFSDIRSFTTISEKMNAHDLVALLNEYFTEMVTIIIAEGGVVDKYIGDAIMAVFGAPVPKSGDAVRAVRAALAMRTALAKLNERLVARGLPELQTGIGIHTGEVVAGNIGSEARMEYTVIGDAVNLASRLESATKDLGVSVLVSEDTRAQLGDALVTRPVAEITVKGRVQAVRTYEPVASPS